MSNDLFFEWPFFCKAALSGSEESCCIVLREDDGMPVTEGAVGKGPRGKVCQGKDVNRWKKWQEFPRIGKGSVFW
jgi:hypothetical protein